jgi:hypothetical protein
LNQSPRVHNFPPCWFLRHERSLKLKNARKHDIIIDPDRGALITISQLHSQLVGPEKHENGKNVTVIKPFRKSKLEKTRTMEISILSAGCLTYLDVVRFKSSSLLVITTMGPIRTGSSKNGSGRNWLIIIIINTKTQSFHNSV